MRVSAFYNWILNITKDATYCQNPLWPAPKKSTIALENEEDLSSNALKLKYYIYLPFFTAIVIYGKFICEF